MWPTIATLIVLFILLLLVKKISRKRKQAQITDPKSLGTSICFLLIAMVNLFAYWFNFIGIVSMSLTMLLLVIGAYFTRYLQADYAAQSDRKE